MLFVVTNYVRGFCFKLVNSVIYRKRKSHTIKHCKIVATISNTNNFADRNAKLFGKSCNSIAL